MRLPSIFIGVDVQAIRPCAYAVLDESGNWLASGWLPRAGVSEIATALRATARACAQGNGSRVAIGIDAPRMPLPKPRVAYWNRANSTWRSCLPSDRGRGRHCEVILAAHRVASPQWTPLAESAPDWMALGFALFDALAEFPNVFEVFPSASYAQLSGDDSVRFQLSLQGFSRGPKDMLDAHVAAVTVREYVQGRGQAVGGGDGCGEIVLARPLTSGPEAVLRWPAP
jgi:hypothetical protein